MKGQHIGQPGSNLVGTATKFAKGIEVASGGRLIIEWNGSGGIVPDTEMLQATGKGAIDIAETIGLYYTGTVPVANFLYGFPGQFQDWLDVIRYDRMGFQDIVNRAYGEFGVHVVALVGDLGLPLFLSKRADTLAGLKGMKLRAGGAFSTVLGNLGVSVVMLPGGEIYTAMSTGVIDGGVYGDWGTAQAVGLPELAKFAVVGTYGGRHGGEFIVNNKVWDSLPPDLRQILEYAFESWGGIWGFWGNEDPAINVMPGWKVRQTFLQKGGTEIAWPKADYDTLAQGSLKLMEELAAKDKYCKEATELFKVMLSRRG